jgi:hypothetical protein
VRGWGRRGEADRGASGEAAPATLEPAVLRLRASAHPGGAAAADVQRPELEGGAAVDAQAVGYGGADEARLVQRERQLLLAQRYSRVHGGRSGWAGAAGSTLA